MNTKGHDCAFPADAETHTDAGLTKREYFAAMAMQGILANPYNAPKYEVNDNWVNQNRVAEIAIYCADELINKLNKEDFDKGPY